MIEARARRGADRGREGRKWEPTTHGEKGDRREKKETKKEENEERRPLESRPDGVDKGRMEEKEGGWVR